MIMLSALETSPGWYDVRFRYDRALVEAVKAIPGMRWNKEKRAWTGPQQALSSLAENIKGLGELMIVPSKAIKLNKPYLQSSLTSVLYPYQTEGAQLLIDNSGFMLTFDPRVGKTPTAIVAAASLLASHHVSTVLILYLNGVREEWTRQFPQFSGGLNVTTIDGTGGIANTGELIAAPYLVLGLHVELLRGSVDAEGVVSGCPTVEDLLAILRARGKYVVINDELHSTRDRKKPRAKMLLEISRGAAWRWGLTGTPERNYPRDLYLTFEFLSPGCVGSYTSYTKRFCDGHEGDYGWSDKGETNAPELASRLAAISFRKTRREVAQWLPKSDFKIVLCEMSKQQAKIYTAKERALGPAAVRAMEESGSVAAVGALRELSTLTSAAKMMTLVERVHYHLCDRKVKMIVWALHHETLNAAEEAIDKANLGRPHFIAGGWMMRDKRNEEIARWKACPGPAVLLVNIRSAGIGIDLSDGDVSIFCEASYVPSEFVQAMDRSMDIHLGKRTTPPLYECLFVKGTVDEDMGVKMISKIQSAENIVGHSEDATMVANAIEASGLVDRGMLGLKNEDPETVAAAIFSLRDRLLAGRLGADTNESIAADAAALDEDEEVDDDDE